MLKAAVHTVLASKNNGLRCTHLPPLSLNLPFAFYDAMNSLPAIPYRIARKGQSRGGNYLSSEFPIYNQMTSSSSISQQYSSLKVINKCPLLTRQVTTPSASSTGIV